MVSVDSSFLDFLKCSVFSSFLRFSRAKWPRRARVCLAFLSCLGFLALSRAKWPRWARVSRFSRVFSVFPSVSEDPSDLKVASRPDLCTGVVFGENMTTETAAQPEGP